MRRATPGDRARSPIRVVIVDHETRTRAAIRSVLAARSDFRVVAEAGTRREAIEVVRAEQPDLLFLQVQMPDSDGLELLTELGERPPEAIVCIASDGTHALEAIRARALDYLLEPLREQRLAEALSRVRDERQRPARTRPPEYLERITVKSAGRHVAVRVDDIDWIEAADYYAQLHIGGETHLVRQSMRSLERQLDPTRFTRVHRSAIVNIDGVHELRHRRSDPGLYAILRCGRNVPVSRRNRRRVQQLL